MKEDKEGEEEAPSTEAPATTTVNSAGNVYADVVGSAEPLKSMKYSKGSGFDCNGCAMRNEALLVLAQHFDTSSKVGRCAAELAEAIRNAQSNFVASQTVGAARQ